MSASRDDPLRPVLIWDLPQRLGHWLMVLCFGVAWFSAESERWRLLHVGAGYTLAGLLMFRLVWGVIGSRHARFSTFVRGPAAVLAYLRSLAGPRPAHHSGHNPAGGAAIVGMLALIGLTTASGWMVWQEWDGVAAGEWLAEGHELLATALLALVGVHVAGVLLGSLAHHENLPRAMITGRKLGSPREALAGARGWIAAALLVVVLGFWVWQWQQAPTGRSLDGSGLGQVMPARLSLGDDEAREHDED
jgi:cytochrome b